VAQHDSRAVSLQPKGVIMRLQAHLLCAVFSLVVGCAGDAPARDLGEAHDDSVALRSDTLESAGAYFVGRQDVRRCRWPLCGGYWVRQVNRPRLRCPDGSSAAECYVALLDTEALGGATLAGFGGGTTLVRGTFDTGDAGEFGTYPLLRADAAWQSAADAAPQGDLQLLGDNGIRCIRAPCFSGTAQRLNTSVSRTFSELDLDGAGASDEQLALATEAFSQRELVATGRFVPTRGGGLRFRASQLYLPVAPLVAPDQCSSDADCTLSFYTAPVGSAAACYCPTCPVPQTAAVAAANAAGWQAYCAETHGFEVCPPAPCAPPPPVACLAGTCGYAFDGPQ
jgi:hypothetical protein